MPTRECKNGFINSYIRYTEPQKSPNIFHTWSAISTIASALGRNVWIDRAYYQLFPNLYMILVSNPGVGCKSTAIDISDELLMKALPALFILRGPLTIAFLADLLIKAKTTHPNQDAAVTIHSREFKVFAKGLYADSGLIERLTDAYDCKTFEYNTKGGGTITIDKICINIKAASTPEWLTTGSANDFVGGGFSSRLTPVGLLKNEKHDNWPEKTDVERSLEGPLIHDLQIIGGLNGHMFITKEAKDFADVWQKNLEKKRNPDRRFDGFYSKVFDMMLKVAISLSVAVSSDLVLDTEHIETSIKLLAKLEENLPFAYQGVSWGDAARSRSKLLTKIQEAGEVTQVELLNAMEYLGMTKNEFTDALHVLIEEELICFELRQTGGRSKHLYKDRKAMIKDGKCKDGKCNQSGCEFWKSKQSQP